MADARVCMTTLQHALARAARVFRVRGSINKKQGDNVIKNTNTNTFKMSDCRIGLGCGWLGLGRDRLWSLSDEALFRSHVNSLEHPSTQTLSTSFRY